MSEKVQEDQEVEEETIIEISTTNDALEFTEQLKNTFQQIVHYKHSNTVWFQASAIAQFLFYENTKYAIIENVSGKDKIRLHEMQAQYAMSMFRKAND